MVGVGAGERRAGTIKDRDLPVMVLAAFVGFERWAATWGRAFPGSFHFPGGSSL